METINVICRLNLDDISSALKMRYTINKLYHPVGEIYDLNSEQVLALALNNTYGYERKIFSTTRQAIEWIQKKIKELYPHDKIEYETIH